MAAVGRKMCLDMGHLDGRAHETKRKSTRCMDEFFGDVGAEKPDWNTVPEKRGGGFPISGRSNRFEFFKDF
jgi:hypothetical protein